MWAGRDYNMHATEISSFGIKFLNFAHRRAVRAVRERGRRAVLRPPTVLLMRATRPLEARGVKMPWMRLLFEVKSQAVLLFFWRFATD